jgi:protein-disulfide isomerase
MRVMNEEEQGIAEGEAAEFGQESVAEVEPPVQYVIRRQPTWTYFLTPIAVVIGALIISGTIWKFSGDDPAAPTVAVAPDTTGAVSEAPGSGAVTKTGDTLLSVFTGYARTLGLNEKSFATCLQKQSNVDLITRQFQRGTDLGINGTPTFFINNKMIIGAQPTQLFEEVIRAELAGSPMTLDGYSANIKALAATNPPRFVIMDSRPDISDAFFEGKPDAKVVVAEFSDFQCPFCKRWVDETLPKLRTTYEPLGVSIAFLHFPITQIHPNAGNASVAAICAAEQGKFWPMHDLLFATQQNWEKLQ